MDHRQQLELLCVFIPEDQHQHPDIAEPDDTDRDGFQPCDDPHGYERAIDVGRRARSGKGQRDQRGCTDEVDGKLRFRPAAWKHVSFQPSKRILRPVSLSFLVPRDPRDPLPFTQPIRAFKTNTLLGALGWVAHLSPSRQ